MSYPPPRPPYRPVPPPAPYYRPTHQQYYQGYPWPYQPPAPPRVSWARIAASAAFGLIGLGFSMLFPPAIFFVVLGVICLLRIKAKRGY